MTHSIEAIKEMIEARELQIKGWEVAREEAIAKRDDWSANWIGEKIGMMQRAVDAARAHVAAEEFLPVSKSQSFRHRIQKG